MSKISVVMPIYNAAKFLRESIDDIRKQTFTDWELICVNDGSTDDCGQILWEYAEIDERIKVFYQDNHGGATARNAGLEIAKGDYVIFLDSDDRFEKNMLEIIAGELEYKPTDVLIFAGDCFDYSSGKTRKATWLLDKKYLNDEFISDGYIKTSVKSEIVYSITNTTVWNKVFNRDFLINNHITFYGNNGSDCVGMVMLALAKATKISVCNKALVHYRENVPTGQLSNVHKRPLDVLDNALDVRARFQKEGLFPEFEQAYINYCVKLVLNRLNRMNFGMAHSQLYEALHVNGLKWIGVQLSNIDILCETQLQQQCKKILETEYMDYLYETNSSMKKMINPTGSIYYLPENCPKNVRIALYGAGNVGKSYYLHLLNSNEHTLVGWFDKNYAKCGYPVENPKNIKNKDFDIVIIAVEMITAANSIKNDLIKLGVEETKIFFAEPKIM